MEQTVLRLWRRKHMDAHVHCTVFRFQGRKVLFQVRPPLDDHHTMWHCRVSADLSLRSLDSQRSSPTDGICYYLLTNAFVYNQGPA